MPNYNIREVYKWSDSTVVLHWLQGNGNHKTPITWRYVNNIQSPVDIGSRGSNISVTTFSQRSVTFFVNVEYILGNISRISVQRV